LSGADCIDFRNCLIAAGCESLRASGIKTLQVNLGYRCNMTCKHCHIEAGPERHEEMDAEGIRAVITALRDGHVKVIDLTGGAPELNPHFRLLIEEARALSIHVMVRTNLTILAEPGMRDLPRFLKSHDVEIVASLPHYTREPVDRVRGRNTFVTSMEVLRTLNDLGYGTGDVALKLSLVYNPQGAFLPPPQSELEETYRRELKARYDVTFDRLFTFANMPVGRFREFLVRSGNLESYMHKLANAFNVVTLPGVMCRHMVSVRWDGALFDCDFNQIRGISILKPYPSHISRFDYYALADREIAVGEHCFGCTAGQGST
jgi:radical SAM/Cys-rich protein